MRRILKLNGEIIELDFDSIISKWIPTDFTGNVSVIENDKLVRRMTMLDGVMHSFNNKPSYEEFSDGCRVRIQMWREHGCFVESKEPNEIRYDKQGNTLLEVWNVTRSMKDYRHRRDGPAMLSKDFIFWYLNGIDFTRSVNDWLESRSIRNHIYMKSEEFDIMWFEIRQQQKEFT